MGIVLLEFDRSATRAATSRPAPSYGPLLLLLGGWPGSGKSTVASILEQSYGAIVLSMSQVLGQVLSRVDENAAHAIEAQGWEASREHLRPKLQLLANTLRECIRPAILMMALGEEISRYLAAGKLVVVDGVRNAEEFAFAQLLAEQINAPHYSVRIARDGQSAPAAAHERQLDEYQHDIKLSYNMPIALRQTVHELMHELRARQIGL